MYLMMQLFGIILATVAVTSHEYGNHGHHSGGNQDYSGSPSSIAAVRSFGRTLGRPNIGWGSSSGYGTNSRSYSHNSNDHSTDYLGRSNCGLNNYGFGVQDSSFRSTWYKK